MIYKRFIFYSNSLEFLEKNWTDILKSLRYKYGHMLYEDWQDFVQFFCIRFIKRESIETLINLKYEGSFDAAIYTLMYRSHLSYYDLGKRQKRRPPDGWECSDRFLDTDGEEDKNFENLETEDEVRKIFAAIFDCLNEKDRKLLLYIIKKEPSMKDFARKHRVSVAHVSRMYNRILKKLKEKGTYDSLRARYREVDVSELFRSTKNRDVFM